MTTNAFHIRSFLLALAAMPLLGSVAFSQTNGTWTTNTTIGDNGTWSDPTKWTSTGVPSGGGNATFGGYANARTVTLDGDYTVGTLTIVPRTTGFVSTTFALTGNNTLTINNGLIIGGGTSITIAPNLVIAADQTWTTLGETGVATLSLSGIVSGNGKITRIANASNSSAGIITFSGANTFSGGFTQNAALNNTRLGSSSTVAGGVIIDGPLGTGTITLNAGRLSSNGGTARTISNNVVLGGGTVELGNSSQNGTLTFSDAGLTTPFTFTLGSATNGNVSVLRVGGTNLTFDQVIAESGGSSQSINFASTSGTPTVTIDRTKTAGGDILSGGVALVLNNGAANSGSILAVNGSVTATGSNKFSSGALISDGAALAATDATNYSAVSGGQASVYNNGRVSFATDQNQVTVAGLFTADSQVRLGLGSGSGNSTVTQNYDQSAIGNGQAGLVSASTGTITYNGALTAGSDNAFRVGGGLGTLVLGTALTGSGNSLIVEGGGTVTSTSNHTYTGTTAVTGTTLTISGTNGALSGTSGVAINNSGTLNLTNNTGAVNADRIGNSVGITLNSGILALNGSSTTAASETLGDLTINSGGRNFITIATTPAAATVKTLQFGTLTRNAGTVAVFRGDSLGGTATPRNEIKFSSAPTLVGGGGAAGTTNISILSWARGGTSAANNATGFVTYETNGIRVLSSTTEYTQANGTTAINTAVGASTDLNVRFTPGNSTLTSFTAASANATVNALLVDNTGGNATTNSASSYSLTGNTINVTSGAVHINHSVGNNLTLGNGTLAFGSAEGVITTNTGGFLTTIGTQITGSGGLTITNLNGGGVSLSAVTTSGFSGNLTIGGNGFVGVDQDQRFGNAANSITHGGGTLQFFAGFSSARDISLLADVGNDTLANNTTSSTVTLTGNITGGGLLRLINNASTVGVGGFSLGGANNTYSGGTQIEGINVTGTTNNALGTGTVTLIGANNNPAALTLTGSAPTLGGLRGTDGTVTVTPTAATATVAIGANNDNTVFNGVIAQGANKIVSVTKTGTGTLVLGGSNTYSGDTLVDAGTLLLTNSFALQNSALDTSGAGHVSLIDSTTPTFGGLKGSTDLVTVISTGYGTVTALTLNPGAGFSNTYSGIIADGAAGMTLTKTGAGTQTLSGANTYTGTTTISAGTLNAGVADVGNTGAMGNGGNITFSGGTLQYSAASAGTDYSTRLKNSTAVSISLDTNSQAVTLAGNIDSSNTGGLTKLGNGTLTLSGANTYTGGTTVSAGILKIGNATALGGDASAASITSGAVLDLNGFTMTGTNALTLNGTGIGGGGALTNSSGTAGTYAGLVTLGGNTSIIASSGNITLANTGTITGSGFGLTLDGTATGSSIASSIGTGSGTLTKQGSGMWTLSGASSYTGATTISAGTLQAGTATNAFGSTSGIGISSTGTLALRGDSNATFGNGTASYAVSLSGSGATIDVNQATTAGTGQTFTLGTLALAGNYTLNVTGNNNTSLTFGAVSASTTNDKVINNNLVNGTLSLGGYAETNASARKLTISGIGDTTIAGNITQNGAALSLTKTGSGTLTLTPSSANTFNGTINANGGRIVADYANGDVLSGQAINTGGGIFEFKGKTGNFTTTDTVGNISATVNTGLGTIVVNKNGGTSTTITAGTVTRANGFSSLLIDLSQGGAITTTTTNTNGILNGNAGLYVRTSSGYDFATNTTNASGGTIGALNAGTTLAATGGGNSTNYKLSSSDLTSGNFTLTGTTGANTLRVDTAGGGTLNINSRAFTNTQILFTGSGNYSVTGTSGTIGNTNLLVGAFGDGKLTLGALMGSVAGVIRISGAGGLVDWTSAANQSGAVDTFGAVLRVSGTGIKFDTTSSGNGSGQVNIANGGVLELTGTNLTRNLAAAAGGVQIFGSGGFSAFNNTNTTRIVNLGSSAQMTWGSGGFATDTFVLGSNFSNAMLDFQNAIDLGTVARVVQVNNGIISNDVDGKLSGNLTGAGGSLVKTGTGTLALSAANTYTGGTTISSGQLNIGDGGTTGSVTGNIINNGTLGFNRTDTGLTYAGVIIGSGAVQQIGSGTTTLAGANTYTGATTVQNGTLAFTVGNATATGAQSLGANTSVTLGVVSTSSGILNYTGNGSATLAKAVNAVGNGSDTIQNSGTGLLTLSGNLTKNGTTLTLKGGSNGINVTGSILGSAANSDLIVDGGLTTLNAANTYVGPTFVINGATLTANVTDSLPAGNRTAVRMDQTGSGSSTLALGADQTIASLTGAATSSVNLNSYNLTMGTTANSTTFAGAISGTGSLTKDGASTQILTGNNSYSGDTTVNAGTLQLANASGGNLTTGNVTINGGSFQIAENDQLGSSSRITINSGGTFELIGSGIAQIIDGFTNEGGDFTTGAGEGHMLAGDDSTINWNNGNNTITTNNTVSAKNWNIRGGNNTVQQGGTLKVSSGGTGLNFMNGPHGPPSITLNSSNSTAGRILLQGNVTVDSSLTVTASILNGGNSTNRGYVDMAGGTRTFNVGNGTAATDFLVSAILSNGTLTKAGNGTMAVTGANTYTGATNVTGGTLLVNGNQTAATGNVTVASGATLGGNGTIGGATTIAGILSPGNGNGTIDTLNIASNVTWQGASSNGTSTDWIFDLASSGSSSDLLNITGSFLKDSTTYGNNFRFNFNGSTPAGTSFTLVDWSGTTGFSAGDFSYTGLGGGLTGSFSITGSQLDFTLSAIPEASTWISMAALALGGGLILLLRRIRKT